MKRCIVLFSILLAMILAACSSTPPAVTPIPTTQPPPSLPQPTIPQPTQEVSTGSPAPTSASSILPGWGLADNLILEDDFSQDQGKTHTVTDSSFNETFNPDGLLVTGLKENWWDFIPYKTNRDVSNVYIGVDTSLVKTDGPGDYGLVCRYNDNNNYYGFYISSVNNTFVIQKTLNNVDTFLRSGISLDIPTGKPMTLQVSCSGDRLALGVNGKLLAEVFDHSLPSGRVGLLVDTGEKAGIGVTFSYLMVYTVTSTPLPTTPTPPAWNAVGSPLIQDSFSKDEGKWVPYHVDTGPLSYQNNELWVTIKKANFTHLIAYQTDLDVKDVLISVNTRLEKATPTSDLGIICRYVEGTTDHYSLTVTPDGHYGIEKWANSKPAFLSYGFSNLIPAGQPMTLQASCVGNKISIGVNGKILSEVNDDSYPSGRLGLQVWAGDPDGFTAAFSQFKVYKP